ncbi:hypothetical protein D3C81_2079870 [compost metagenome]
MRTLFGTGVKENFNRRIREHHRAHITAIGDQARSLAECALAAQQRLTNSWECGRLRSRIANGFGADLVTDVLTFQNNLQFAVLSNKADVEMGGQGD